ncbi:hypothetical protein [Staphylococcus massiliensis]|uniref:Uncharacterized protein n=1 Tax=Staphylococcus massiliensis S46 TaxID=1229783 RepID=K9AN73_9STAP|nr:hypothetical protein [Staphylococcus massiliensis]EKU47506.1 hypothetical protein C273_07407 [Staphylococcus massiliensis S46]MCG3398580.1 hypothetical protein [Staphylococcus massiliensis]MCG3401145.1 hypothetical protein [Staphylococcus massiliensis]MCG3412281.1 hypothetical protein [Staphylococcus massiliensis]PNZ99276.1 hypothetical protein CD133_06760 [Staphylococcus massiliensis CCUG 55927]
MNTKVTHVGLIFFVLMFLVSIATFILNQYQNNFINPIPLGVLSVLMIPALMFHYKNVKIGSILTIFAIAITIALLFYFNF